MWAVLALAALPPLMVDAPPGLPCAVERDLEVVLKDHGLTVGWRAPARLTLRRTGKALDVRLTSGQRLLGQRVLKPAPGDCPEVPRTVALFARAWLSEDLPPQPRSPSLLPNVRETNVELEEAPVRPTERRRDDARRPAPAPREPTPPAPDERSPRSAELARTLESPPEPSPPPRDIVAEVLPPAPLSSDAGVIDIKVESRLEPAPLPGPASSRRVLVALGGGGAWGPLDQPTGHAWAGADVDVWRGWGLSADVGFDSSRSAAVATGRVEATMVWASLVARRLFFAREASGLIAALGARVQLLSATSTGLTRDGSALLPTVAMVGHLDWRQRLVGRFFVLARVGVLARLQPETLVIAGFGPALTIPAWNGFGALAAGWAFE